MFLRICRSCFMKRILIKKLIGNFALIFSILAVCVSVAAVSAEKNGVADVWEEETESKEEVSALPIIVIDPGHGGADCGAVGINGLLEKDVNLRLSRLIQKEFERVGYKVAMTRTEDILLTDEGVAHTTKKSADLAARVKAAKKGDIFISVHMNKFPEEKYSGAQIYYSVNNEKSKTLAEMIQKAIVNGLQPQNNRVIKSGEGLYLLDRIDIPAVIAECGFLSNGAEAEQLKDEEYLKSLAFEIFSAIDDFVMECEWE